MTHTEISTFLIKYMIFIAQNQILLVIIKLLLHFNITKTEHKNIEI